MSDEKHRRKIDEQKAIFDAVTKEWLDDKFATFGKWTFKAILAVIFVIFLKLVFHLNYHDLREILETTGQVQDLAR